MNTEAQNHREIVSLRDYLEKRIDYVERASDLASRTLEKRLEGMNEFRGQLKDQASKLTTRIETSALEKRVQDLELAKAEMDGKANQSEVNRATTFAMVGIGIGACGLVVSLLVLFM